MAVPHGPNSGHEDCFMRYIRGFVYQRENGYVYPYPPDNRVAYLCTAPDGTGKNKEQRTETLGNLVFVFPMVGDAEKGNCAGQLRVTDVE